MTRTATTTALLAALVLAACSPPAPTAETGWTATDETPAPEDVSAARQAARTLGAALKVELVDAIQAEGPVSAITVCNERAPAIAADIGARTGMRVGRTSLRVRNPANAPDGWETARLEDFAARIAAGEAAPDMSAAAIFTRDGQRELRWTAPIMMGDVCTLCHGEEIAPEIAQAIAARYPDDHATGFARDALRGAFTVRLPLAPDPAPPSG